MKEISILLQLFSIKGLTPSCKRTLVGLYAFFFIYKLSVFETKKMKIMILKKK